ncbi:hypothetical protein M758_6G091800 [Ceratodon purpureus]|nr:hypothetical protein M758_6G091800 [Ceratodon purpureus]
MSATHVLSLRLSLRLQTLVLQHQLPPRLQTLRNGCQPCLRRFTSFSLPYQR